jgi:hypothetical protein
MSVRESPEDRRLLNPAFAGALVVRASQGFWKEARRGLPYIYAYWPAPGLDDTRLS